jgi:hypothetical protein
MDMNACPTLKIALPLARGFTNIALISLLVRIIAKMDMNACPTLKIALPLARGFITHIALISLLVRINAKMDMNVSQISIPRTAHQFAT